jgi:hypothetical protein
MPHNRSAQCHSSPAGRARRVGVGMRRWLGLATVLVAVLGSLELLPAATVAYDIVYVRVPRDGDDKQVKWADVYGPMHVEAGSDLVLLHPDGTEEVLVAAGKGAIADPCVSFDAQWVYYSYLPDVDALTPILNTPKAGADIYKISLRTRRVVRLTNQEYTPNTSVRKDALPYGIYNMGPCPVAGGKVVFTSTRNAFIPPKQYTPVTSQLYVMDEDGSNVRAIAPMTIGAAMHPFQLKDGRIAFSTQEAQGLRDNRVWALWAIWPDGRHWEPLMSAFSPGDVLHFATELSNTNIVVEDYYNAYNMGFGTFYKFPSVPPAGAPPFNSPIRAKNPPLQYTDSRGVRVQFRYSFTPAALVTLTPFSTMFDEAAAPSTPGGTERVGKVMHPSSAPNNDLLLVWSPGPVNLLQRPVTTPAPDAGLYIARGGGVVERPSDLVLIKNDPRFNEIWPRAVVPYRAIYGVEEPFEFPFLPNDGTVHPALPEGTPYGIIGTSSFYKRDSFPGFSQLGAAYDGLDAFNAPGEDLNSNWTHQGADAGKYSSDEIAAVRILLMEPQTEMTGAGGSKFFNHVNERLRILGEIPLRKTGADGKPVRDPEGNPDTSFWAKVPADTPITFQMLDAAGRVLTMAQTWHQVRPGEVRVDCGGCHAHSQMPLAFERTAAAKLPPADLTLQPAHDVEFVRDIRPILQRACVSCHKGDPATAPGQLALDDRSDIAGVYPDKPEVRTPTDYARLAYDRSARWGIKPPQGAHQQWVGANASRYARVFQSRRSLLAWKLAGQRTDGWANAQFESSAPFKVDASRYTWDIDFDPGSVDHSTLLTDDDKRKVYAWIDLALPIDLGGGYFRDENRPTLTVKVANGQIIVGAADGYSGLDEASLSVTVNRKTATLSSRGAGVWVTPAPADDSTIVVRVKDRAGNWTEFKLTPRQRRPE